MKDIIITLLLKKSPRRVLFPKPLENCKALSFHSPSIVVSKREPEAWGMGKKKIQKNISITFCGSEPSPFVFQMLISRRQWHVFFVAQQQASLGRDRHNHALRAFSIICGRIKTLWSQWTIALTSLWHPRHVFSLKLHASELVLPSGRSVSWKEEDVIVPPGHTIFYKLEEALHVAIPMISLLCCSSWLGVQVGLDATGRSMQGWKRCASPNMDIPTLVVPWCWRLKSRSGMICWAICINLTFSNQCGPVDFISFPCWTRGS